MGRRERESGEEGEGRRERVRELCKTQSCGTHHKLWFCLMLVDTKYQVSHEVSGIPRSIRFPLPKNSAMSSEHWDG